MKIYVNNEASALMNSVNRYDCPFHFNQSYFDGKSM